MTNEQNIPLVGQPPKMKLAVALVSHEMVPFTFATDFAVLFAFTASVMPDDCEISLKAVSGTYVHSGRQKLLEELLAEGHTHILWVDSDMRFPRDAVLRLMAHDVPVVGINYAKREIPTDFVAIKHVARDENDRSVRLTTDDMKTGIEEVDALGFGMVLMRTSALRDLPSLDAEPWFWFKWLPGRRQMGEDVYFCELLRDRGVRLFVDHDLSKECAHTGQWEYKIEHVLMQKGG